MTLWTCSLLNNERKTWSFLVICYLQFFVHLWDWIFSASHDSLDMFPFVQQTKNPVFLGYLLPAIYRLFIGWEMLECVESFGDFTWLFGHVPFCKTNEKPSLSGLFVTSDLSFIYRMGNAWMRWIESYTLNRLEISENKRKTLFVAVICYLWFIVHLSDLSTFDFSS